jgi:hypothetical protein
VSIKVIDVSILAKKLSIETLILSTREAFLVFKLIKVSCEFFSKFSRLNLAFFKLSSAIARVVSVVAEVFHF